MHYLILTILGWTLWLSSVLAQPTSFDKHSISKTELLNEIERKLSITEVELSLTKSFISRNSGLTHTYFNQVIGGIEVYNAVSNIATSADGTILMTNVRAYAPIVETTLKGIDESDALESARHHFDLNFIGTPIRRANIKSRFYDPSLSKRDVVVKPIYYPLNDQLILAWSVAFEKIDNLYWYDLIIDATGGTVINQIDWTLECFDNHHICGEDMDSATLNHDHVSGLNKSASMMNNSYNVYAMPFESPSEADRMVVSAPWLAANNASPFGWHDTDGTSGAEFTTTRGNNVYASEDADGDNIPGVSPDGGANLEFDFPIDLSTQRPEDYIDAATINLFYWNNIVHDVLYEYGFDEAAGNFQETNYTGMALGGDFINADCQDVSGINNATFTTPPDGINPRMTMFRWLVSDLNSTSLTINSPGSIAGIYGAAQSTFGLQDTSVTGALQLVDDGIDVPSDACEDLGNTGLEGLIAMVDRGDCTFVKKVREAQQAQAAGVIICNNEPGAIFSPGGFDNNLNIPSAMVSQQDCDLIKMEMQSGTVTATLELNANYLDSDLDNGIIAHEYGHGWSNRLTGGASTSGCLSGSEQMGEGWSDFLGLITTIKPGEIGLDSRGIGAYVSSQDSLGSGIRTHPYSTDLTINPHTYDDIANESVPHGVGSVWCAMLWDMTWLLIDKYGYDPDIYHGTGGNNIALALVAEGLMLQPCDPGFVDGRNAILAADVAMYGGVNQCLIWEAFSRRGLGFSADQGTSTSNADGTEAFDMPPSCFGCMDLMALNFDLLVTQDDGSCYSCNDGVQNGNEDDVDCGGSDCDPCPCTCLLYTSPSPRD